jgi:hypothetical protein
VTGTEEALQNTDTSHDRQSLRGSIAPCLPFIEQDEIGAFSG